ncbi:hypothetical protein C8Q76DRAFT_803287 [Earliella scabrosa]|nr:hypothetical protein C8Q76DRAFT_803287 [Earliella scabrosa]
MCTTQYPTPLTFSLPFRFADFVFGLHAEPSYLSSVMLPRHKLAASAKRASAARTASSAFRASTSTAPSASADSSSNQATHPRTQSHATDTSDSTSPNAGQGRPAPRLPKGAVLVKIPGRDPRLPKLWLVKTHVKVKVKWQVKRIFIYLQDTSPKAMEEYYKFVAAMPFPEGMREAIRKAGFFFLKPGDYVFCRDIRGSQKEEDDVLQLWVPAD